MNKSYLWAFDDKHGWNYTTYFSFFNDFYRDDEKMKYVEISFITILCVVSVILNSSLTGFILCSRELRTRQHMFIVSVLCSSMFLLPFAMAIGITRLSPLGWMFGNFFCKSTMYAFLTTAFIKIWLMSVISMDRYLQVVHLQHRHLGRRMSIALTIAAWTLPMITLACMVYPNTVSVQSTMPDNTTVTICSAIFRYHDTIPYAVVYFLSVFVLEYVIPASLMIMFYTKVMQKIKLSAQALLRHNKAPNKSSKTDEAVKNNAKERRATLILIIILLLFLLMWTPLFGLLAMLSLDQRLETYYLSSRFIIGGLCSLLANTIIEPILFALTTGQVRQKLLALCQTRQPFQRVSIAPMVLCVTEYTTA
ncbi:substance-P receptor-like [Watersipora subatra]|uniref:substance-P receptor-like n=1 Tax=Watersipora subatra TaxID=2589382 RepID=UPI00355BADA6